MTQHHFCWNLPEVYIYLYATTVEHKLSKRTWKHSIYNTIYTNSSKLRQVKRNLDKFKPKLDKLKQINPINIYSERLGEFKQIHPN